MYICAILETIFFCPFWGWRWGVLGSLTNTALSIPTGYSRQLLASCRREMRLQRGRRLPLVTPQVTGRQPAGLEKGSEVGGSQWWVCDRQRQRKTGRQREKQRDKQGEMSATAVSPPHTFGQGKPGSGYSRGYTQKPRSSAHPQHAEGPLCSCSTDSFPQDLAAFSQQNS